jgi:hypothetical protein
MSYDVDLLSEARLWPYVPDWGGGFAVKRAFETDIITSRNGTEQRRALRFAPRLSASYRTVVSGDDRRAAEHLLRAWQNKPVAVPDFTRWARLTGASGSSSLTVSPLPSWAVAGQGIVVCKAGVQELATIDAAAGATITLAGTLANSFASGDVIRPVFFGLLDATTGSSRPNSDAAAINVSVNSYPGGEPLEVAGSPWATLGSYEVFVLAADYGSQPTLDHVWPVEQVDFNRGRTAQFRPIDWAAVHVEATFSGLTVTKASEVEQFFGRRKGRRGAFYLPGGARDFLPTSYGSASFTVAGTALADDLGSVDYIDVNEGVAVCLLDGTTIYRRISSIAVASGNSIVTVDSAWGVSLSSANVSRISRMPLVRFASDEMTTSWRTPLVASTRLTFQQVKA